jgi:ankyrin repeat protein
MAKFLAGALALVWLSVVSTASGVAGAAPADDVYQAIRANDLARLKTLVRARADANAPGDQGETPLMSAAAVGSIEAMRFLLEQGADVNAQNAFGSTALVWSATDRAKTQLLLDRGATVDTASKTGRTALFVAAMSDGSAPIVRLLIAKGANPKGRDVFQNTMLTAAAVGNDLDTMRVFVDAGVDVNAVGVTGLSPLIAAAYNANLDAVKLFLSKGASVNAVASSPTLFPLDSPKSGPLALSAVTPLMAAAASAPPELVKALIDAGAHVNATDGRRMTPLMLAVATNHQNPAVIRLLVDRGADVRAQSSIGETAADWARKIGAPAGLEMLKVARSAESAAAPVAVAPGIDAKTAAARAMALLETSSQKFFESSGCVSCHHQNVADLAAGEARAKGVRVDAQAAIERLEMLAAGPPPALLLERMDINVPEILASTLAGLASVGVPPDRATDKMAVNIAAAQRADGSWKVVNGIGARPPAGDGDISRAALCIRSLTVYAPPGRADMRARSAKARQWLAAATPITAEERNMQLLGLHWAGADAATLKPLAAAILAAQQRDGGWRQRDGLSTDAYATGQSLYALARAGGVPAADPAYKRGVAYLLSTQAANGSWRVTSRAPKFQAYFNSGFPYAGDQWISAWATGWATMALAQAAQ